MVKAKRRSTPVVDPAVADDWNEAAVALASWASEHLLNNTKGYGGYVVYEDGSVGLTTHKQPPDLTRLVRHFRARISNDLVGLHALMRDDEGRCWSRWTATDIDKHDDAEGDAAASLKLALAVHDRAKAAGFTPLLSDSNGKGGFHVVALYSQRVDARLARAFGRWLVRDWEAFGVDGAPEVFPKQDEVGPDGWGNWLRLFGHHHKRDRYSRVGDGTGWLEGRAAIDFILGVTGGSPDLITPEVLVMLAEEKAAKAALASYGRFAHDLAEPDLLIGSASRRADAQGSIPPNQVVGDPVDYGNKHGGPQCKTITPDQASALSPASNFIA